MLFNAGYGLLSLISIGLLVLKAYAFLDCTRRPAGAFVAFGKLTKPAWLGITAVSAVFQLLSSNPIGLFSVIGTVASIVYLVDVKPAVTGTGS
ncbi:MAG: uncharacterized protein JWN31_1324 [Frankiales bacterium]|nr:uncharacterized protein [Frankiales bacterium]